MSAAVAGCLPRAQDVITRLGEDARRQAAEFIADRRARLQTGHPAAAVLAALGDAVAQGGVLETGPGRMSEQAKYQVSLVLHAAADAAANDNGPERRVPAAMGVLTAAALDWDRAAGVSGAPSWRRHVAAGQPPGVWPKDLGAA